MLDTCTGLGYTALAAAAHADHVTTVELDPAVHAIIQQNPWSCALFDAPNPVSYTHLDVYKRQVRMVGIITAVLQSVKAIC